MKKRLNIQFHRSCKLWLVCVDTMEDIETFAVKQGIEVPEDKTDFEGLFAKQGRVFYIIFHLNTSVGDLAHEVVHFLNTIYFAIGQELSAENDEMYSHQLSYFVDECFKFQHNCKLSKL